jgi:predicted TIM-barrel fold metal-dependent hydrolase
MPRPTGVLVDTHIHLFAKDQTRFPYAPTGTYQPPPADLEDYKKFVAEARLDHGVIVHPEPYQDDQVISNTASTTSPSQASSREPVCLTQPEATRRTACGG